MGNTPIFAAGFGHRENTNGGKITFTKAFRRRTEKNPNHEKVDDMVRILTDLGVYKGGGAHILLSEISDLEVFKILLEASPHDGAILFVKDAQDSEKPLNEFVIVIMVSEAMNSVQADLLRKADEQAPS